MKIDNTKLNKEYPDSRTLQSMVRKRFSKPTIVFKFEHFDVPKDILANNKPADIPKNCIGNLVMFDQQGFRFSQVLDSMLYYYENNPTDPSKIVLESARINCEEIYLIPIAVKYNPTDWTDRDLKGGKSIGKKSVFEYISSRYLTDLQNGRAILMIDQSVEGYSTAWLWDWFHEKCAEYNINPRAIIYLTGDQMCETSYSKWCTIHNPAYRLKVIRSTSLSMYIYKHFTRYIREVNFDDLLEYKRKNKKNLYLYDCINMKPRIHRIFNFLHLHQENLDKLGNISMPHFNEWKDYVNCSNHTYANKHGLTNDTIDGIENYTTPRVANYKYDHKLNFYYEYVERILDDLYKNSWVSLTTESSYFAWEQNIFVSEKTFKPIACMQPFIICGSKNTLQHIRALGYKTFHPFIDETYDLMPDTKRFQAIIESIKKIKSIKNKVEWFKSMRPILEHNYQKFMEIGHIKSHEHQEIEQHYFNYRGMSNV